VVFKKETKEKRRLRRLDASHPLSPVSRLGGGHGAGGGGRGGWCDAPSACCCRGVVTESSPSPEVAGSWPDLVHRLSLPLRPTSTLVLLTLSLSHRWLEASLPLSLSRLKLGGSAAVAGAAPTEEGGEDNAALRLRPMEEGGEDGASLPPPVVVAGLSLSHLRRRSSRGHRQIWCATSLSLFAPPPPSSSPPLESPSRLHRGSRRHHRRRLLHRGRRPPSLGVELPRPPPRISPRVQG